MEKIISDKIQDILKKYLGVNTNQMVPMRSSDKESDKRLTAFAYKRSQKNYTTVELRTKDTDKQRQILEIFSEHYRSNVHFGPCGTLYFEEYDSPQNIKIWEAIMGRIHFDKIEYVEDYRNKNIVYGEIFEDYRYRNEDIVYGEIFKDYRYRNKNVKDYKDIVFEKKKSVEEKKAEVPNKYIYRRLASFHKDKVSNEDLEEMFSEIQDKDNSPLAMLIGEETLLRTGSGTEDSEEKIKGRNQLLLEAKRKRDDAWFNTFGTPKGYRLTTEWRTYDQSYLKRGSKGNPGAVDPRLINIETGLIDYPLSQSSKFLLITMITPRCGFM